MVYYNNPKAIQVVHEALIHEGRRQQNRRHLLRLVKGDTV